MVGNIKNLFKLAISISVSFSAFTGYFIGDHFSYSVLLFLITGTFLLASGTSILNQLQEKNIDSLMLRTKNRPIPAKQITEIKALLISIILIIMGAVFLFLGTTFLCFLLGLFNVFWYNGVYTYLKRVTSLAVIPGAITGAVPVLMGWTASGGSIFNPIGLVVAFFLFSWQIPHFWLIVLKYGKQYEEAGLASLTTKFSMLQIRRFIFISIIFTVCISFIMTLGIVKSEILGMILICISLGFALYYFRTLFYKRNLNKFDFHVINVYLLMILLTLIFDKLLMA
jgi:protoheme IX farnesyltransferase